MRLLISLTGLWMAGSLCLPVQGQEAGLFNEVVSLLEKSGIAFDENRARRAAAIVLVQSADPLGGLLTETQAQRLKERHAGRIYDSGIRLIITNGLHRIHRMDPGTPAPRAGVHLDDVILAVDGKKFSSNRFSEAVELLRSRVERTLKLTLQNAEGEIRELVLTLRTGQLKTVEITEALPEEIGYIKINGLYKNGAVGLVKQLRNWEQQGKVGLILDLRNAGGRNLAAVKTIAEQFAPASSPLFTVQHTPLNRLDKFESGETTPITLPVMILVNRRTSGASELLAAALKGSGLGVMVLGETTEGDFALRNFIKLAGGDYLYLATHQVVMSDGTTYDGSRGIQPDIEVADVNMKVDPVAPEPRFNHRETGDEDRIGERIQERTAHDAIMQRAFDVLLGLKALNIRAFGKTP